MIASIKKSLKDQDKLQHFNSVIEMAFGLHKRKDFIYLIMVMVMFVKLSVVIKIN